MCIHLLSSFFYKKKSLAVAYLLSKRLVDLSTQQSMKWLLLCTFAWTFLPKELTLCSMNWPWLHCAPPYLCAVVSLSNSQRNILLTKEVGSAYGVLPLIKSGMCILSTKETSFYLCRGSKTKSVLIFSDQSQNYLLQTKMANELHICHIKNN